MEGNKFSIEIQASNNDKKVLSLLEKYKQKLETVSEVSNEFSREATETVIRLSAKSNNKSISHNNKSHHSPFTVERIDYEIHNDDSDELKIDLPNSFLKVKTTSSRAKKQVKKGIEETPDINAQKSQTTRNKSPKLDNMFFSSIKKKKSSQRHQIKEGGSGKIKIINNIFQNTYLQNIMKHKSPNKSKILEGKGSFVVPKSDQKNEAAKRTSFDIGNLRKDAPQILFSPVSKHSKVDSFLSNSKIFNT